MQSESGAARQQAVRGSRARGERARVRELCGRCAIGQDLAFRRPFTSQPDWTKSTASQSSSSGWVRGRPPGHRKSLTGARPARFQGASCQITIDRHACGQRMIGRRPLCQRGQAQSIRRGVVRRSGGKAAGTPGTTRSSFFGESYAHDPGCRSFAFCLGGLSVMIIDVVLIIQSRRLALVTAASSLLSASELLVMWRSKRFAGQSHLLVASIVGGACARMPPITSSLGQRNLGFTQVERRRCECRRPRLSNWRRWMRLPILNGTFVRRVPSSVSASTTFSDSFPSR